ncbi:MAG TPA: sensor histidine kinase [Rhizomicrobium sp.]|nr:sensor histidine kinase [Rhizomicrobium sp.]
MKQLFEQIEDARLLAQTIVDTVREPLLVLDDTYTIQFASGSFHKSFQIGPEDTLDKELFALENGAWNIPALRTLLAQTILADSAMDVRELAHDFPRIGRRIFLLHARKAIYGGNARPTLLLGFEDVTERRAIEHEKERLQKHADDLLQQKEMLLEEMQHRIVNSLQIIASILMLKARAVTSEETRHHLQDAHRRVMSVAAVQQHLHSSARADLIEVAPYLTKLCDSLTQSIIGEDHPAKLRVMADGGNLISGDAVSVGLIVTELVINALKYAFPDTSKPAEVVVRYEVEGTNWKLSVCDNGVGRADNSGSVAKPGLGTSLVKALANQLDARVNITSGPTGVSVTITHATFTSRFPQAA